MLRFAASLLALALAVPLVSIPLVTIPLAATATAASPYEERYAAGLSTPREDSYYPDKGDPGIDTLHYGLDLTWLRRARQLRGKAEIEFRATTSDSQFQLDLAGSMNVRRVTVDDHVVPFTHTGKTLFVRSPVAANSQYTVAIEYRGTPSPAKGPASRSDIAKVGMRVTKDGQLWTMQEPFGAFTWYPSNDQPSDKAMYDVKVDVPGTWVGVSNGRMTHRSTVNGRTVTEWTNANPMSSYLVTIGVGPYKRYRQSGPHGLPMTYWVPRNRPELVEPLLRTPAAVRWLEQRLGPYPFDRIGVLVTPSGSAMETQNLITFGVKNYRYGARQVRRTIVHELAHQWYGDSVTPNDWRDVWMNEGMATYQDTRWAVAQGWTTWRSWQREWAQDDQFWRDIYGPPGAYDRGEFASINVYYCAALMWDRLRLKLGTTAFNRLVRAWPQVRAHRDSNQSRATIIGWIEQRTGRELSGFFSKWLTSQKSPA